MKRVSAREKVERDQRLIGDRARGLTWATVASRHGVSESQARAIWRDARSHPAATDTCPDPAETVDEILCQLETLIEEAALLTAQTKNEAVKLGALKLRFALLRGKTETLQVLAQLPGPQRLHDEVELAQNYDLLVAVLKKHNVADPIYEDLMQELEAATAIRTPALRRRRPAG